MRIISVPRFVLGIIDIIIALLLIFLTIFIFKTRMMYRLVIAAACLFSGIMTLIESIETKKQMQRREADLKKILQLLGWDKKN